jgi:DNA-binding CsgD family transcriptional regulator
MGTESEPMVDLLLREREQAAVRALLASECVPGVGLPGDRVLPHLAQLVDCDALGIALLDGTGAVVGEVALLRDRATGSFLLADDGPGRPGDAHLRGATSDHGSSRGRSLDLLTIRVRNGADDVAQLWLVRRTTRFSRRDRALFSLVAPALERLLRERLTSSPPPSLTVQERRVLQLVAAGLANGEIAKRLVVAPATVRKHLENVYRKLGVTNRLAAVYALEGRSPADLDRVGSLPSAAR